MRTSLLAMIILCCSGAVAQENITRPRPGSTQLGVLGNWSSTGGVSTYQVNLEGGYYLSDRLVGLVRAGIGKHSPEQRQFFLGARYEFGSGHAAVPYIVAGMEFHDDARSSSNSFIVDPMAGPKGTFIAAGAGVNFLLNAHVAAFAELVAFRASGTNDIGTDLQVGLRVFFRR